LKKAFRLEPSIVVIVALKHWPAANLGVVQLSTNWSEVVS
jgi:hypothetical protein